MNGAKENQENYRLLTENSNDLIARLSIDGICRYVSPACESLLGYTSTELIGTNAFNLIHPLDKRAIASMIEPEILFQLRKKPRADGSWSVMVTGRLNGATISEFKRHMASMVDDGKKKLVIDMSGVVFVDSSGLSALISGLKIAREAGGWLKLASLQDQPLSVIKLMLLDRVFEILPSAEAGV